MIDGDESGGGFSLVEHPLRPARSGGAAPPAPREDEYSYVLEGRVGALLGDDVVDRRGRRPDLQAAEPVAHVLERGDEPARLLEIISPAGFERFFAELVDLGGALEAEPEQLMGLCRRYELELDPSTIPGLVERFGVRFPGDPV